MKNIFLLLVVMLSSCQSDKKTGELEQYLRWVGDIEKTNKRMRQTSNFVLGMNQFINTFTLEKVLFTTEKNLKSLDTSSLTTNQYQEKK